MLGTDNKSLSLDEQQRDCVDKFYADNGPCCAGCDWWRYHNSLVGDCTKAAPVSGNERIGMLGIQGSTLPLEAGFPMTPRENLCGDFRDEN